MNNKSMIRKAPGGLGAFRLHTVSSEPHMTTGKDTPISDIVAELFRIMGTDVPDISQYLQPGKGFQLEGRPLIHGSTVALVFHADGDIEIYYEPRLLEFLDRFEMLSRAHLDGLRAFESGERTRGLDTVILAGRWFPPNYLRRGGMLPYLVGRKFDDVVTYAPVFINQWCMGELLSLPSPHWPLETKANLANFIDETQIVINSTNSRFEEMDGIPLVEGMLWSVMDRSDRHSNGRMIAGFRMMSKTRTLKPELRSKML